MKVVIADDDPVSRLILQAAVKQFGHEPLDAASGTAAWELINVERPEVLITDWLMPDIEGPELTRRIRADSQLPYVYTILLTALSSRDHVIRGMESGADDFLTKPLDSFQLHTRLIAAERVMSLHKDLEKTRFALAEAAMTDSLTTLGNRRKLDVDLRALHAVCHRHDRTYAVFMADVDNFKAYNDTYGHAEGDKVLETVAQALRLVARETDQVYRYGGEEMVVVMPEQDAQKALNAAERHRAAVESLAMPHSGNGPGLVTISAGVTAFRGPQDKHPIDVLRRADLALYEAKGGGRNRVVAAE